MGSKTKTWAELSQCSFLSLAFLMLSLLWQRDSLFSFKKAKPSFHSLNNFMGEPAHIAESTQKRKTKAVMKQSRGSLLPCLFISNSDTCIRQSADTRNLRSYHATSFLYSCGFKPPPLILIFGPLWLCCKLWALHGREYSLISFHLFSRSKICF